MRRTAYRPAPDDKSISMGIGGEIMPTTVKPSEVIEKVRALPAEFESHSLDALGVWLNKNYCGVDVSEALSYEVMLDIGFVEEPLEEMERLVGQRESWQLRRLRDALKGQRKALKILDEAPKPICWNGWEILIYAHGRYEVTTWGEYGCYVSDAFRELVNPMHYIPAEYHAILSDAGVRAALI